MYITINHQIASIAITYTVRISVFTYIQQTHISRRCTRARARLLSNRAQIWKERRDATSATPHQKYTKEGAQHGAQVTLHCYIQLTTTQHISAATAAALRSYRDDISRSVAVAHSHIFYYTRGTCASSCVWDPTILNKYSSHANANRNSGLTSHVNDLASRVLSVHICTTYKSER